MIKTKPIAFIEPLMEHYPRKGQMGDTDSCFDSMLNESNVHSIGKTSNIICINQRNITQQWKPLMNTII